MTMSTRAKCPSRSQLIQVRFWLNDRRGVSAIEFAIIASVTVTLMVGAYDLGDAAQRQIALQEAVRSGGAYAATNPTDLPGIRNVVTNALPAGYSLQAP